MWALGMSLLSAGDMLSAFGESLSRTSVLARRPKSGGNARRRLAERAPERASAVGADETHVRVKGKKKDSRRRD